MYRLLILVPALVLFGGCNQNREAYYKTRHIPASSDDVYGLTARATWTGNTQIYQLPATPPDIKGRAEPAVDCAKPGPKFKSTALVAWADPPVRSTYSSDVIGLVAMKQDRPEGAVIDLRRHPMVAAKGSLFKPGVGESPYLVRTGGMDTRPRSTTGAGNDEYHPYRIVSYNDRYDPYCIHDDSFGALPASPSPGEDKPGK